VRPLETKMAVAVGREHDELIMDTAVGLVDINPLF
jgi:hypothetical protein